ncbi:MAG: NF038143 family protein [Dehalococcoidales bacterium]
MHTQYGIILSYEESFARAVAIGVIVREPLTVWHLLIPLVFIFDFFRRKRDTEIFARNFLFTKKLALDAAFDINQGEDRQSRLAKVRDETRDRLVSQKLYSGGIHQGQMAEVDLLIDHYAKLLKAEGNSYESLVKNAYQTRENYEALLHQLTSAEREIDRAVFKTLGETEEVWQPMLTKHTVIDEMRAKGVRKLFPEARRD